MAFGLLSTAAQGQVISRNGDGVEAMFASQSEVYKDSDPTGILWGLAGIGPYPSGAGIPGLPASPTPSISPASGNPFAGGGWNTFFNDLAGPTTFTAAQSIIDDSISATPTVTSDVNITIPAWRFFQAPAATGYAYEQLNFGSNYLFTSNPGLGGSTPGLPIFISGSVIPGGSAYAQFDGVIDYTWFPVAVNTAGLITPNGPQVPLGSLTYTFTQTGGGSFATTLFSSGSLLATPSGNGILALDGHLWIAGDPFSLTVSTVPEPSSIALLGFGVVGLLGYGWRRGR
ncbi:MAG TPA: PEP-CTERM sorting domain-containing protein [Pirellulales bacterium]